MAMPRPTGRAQRIAEAVIPGLKAKKKPKRKRKVVPSLFFSEVEVRQTRNIEHKEGLR